MKVVLVTMPFASVDLPNLGLGLLQARLRERGADCVTTFPSLAFAEKLGLRAYERIAVLLDYWTFAGEWVFTEALYGSGADPGHKYFETVLKPTFHLSDVDLELLRQARSEAPSFVEETARSILARDCDVVGFSSVFAQNISSLAVARRVKLARPKVTTVFGGANWHGVMGEELHRRFPFVDLAFLGEADDSLPEAIDRLAHSDHSAIAQIPGVAYRSAGRSVVTGAPVPVDDLDALPLPDFSDFFAVRPWSVGQGAASVPMETSRGCWWAQSSCCGFCGLNGSTRGYRAKRPDRVLRELRTLAATYPRSSICLADNVVSPSFLRDVLPELATRPACPSLFLDIRPNVTKEQVRLLGCVRAMVQPGIESLNDHVLELMNKGTRTLENIRLLKWCRTYGVIPLWNVIYGFPGETDEDYDEMLALLPAIRFLRPPEGCGQLRLDRHSPFHESSAKFGFRDVAPLEQYSALYPFGRSSLERIACTFAFRCEPDRLSGEQARRVNESIGLWQRGFSYDALHVREDPDGTVTLLDRRSGSTRRRIVLSQLEGLLYLAGEDIASVDELHARARARYPDALSLEADVDACLARFDEWHVVVRVGDRCLSLALPEETGWSRAVRGSHVSVARRQA